MDQSSTSTTPTSSNNHQQQQQTQTQTSNNQQAQAFYQNKEIESLLESNWVSIKDRETAVLEFLTSAGKIKVVEKPDFSGKLAKRVQFAVVDVNDAQRREKTFDLGKIHVEKIYAELQRGKTILEISRSGSGKDTRYFVKPVR